MTPPSTLVGVEHEYGVSNAGASVDFRGLLPRLGLTGARIDPGDAQAVRTPDGVVITCDGAEAEVASPPVAVEPGFGVVVGRWAHAGEQVLLGALERHGPAYAVTGLSTHISVGLSSADALRIGPAFARRFGVPLLLLTENIDADGLLVRPRHGRLELGVDYVRGDHRRAALVLAVGGALACVRAGTGGRAPLLPPAVAVPLEPAVERFGWYLDRRASGEDLYASGRSTPLRTTEGRAIDAGRHLELAWAAAVAALGPAAADADLAPLTRLVSDGACLPAGRAPDRAVTPGPLQLPDSPAVARALRPRARPHFSVRAVVASWWCTVFELLAGRRAYAVVPAEDLDRFLADLESGRLDETIRSFLAAAPSGRVARGWGQHDSFELYDNIGPTSDWAPPERDPAGTFVASGAVAQTGAGARPGKGTTTTAVVVVSEGEGPCPICGSSVRVGAVTCPTCGAEIPGAVETPFIDRPLDPHAALGHLPGRVPDKPMLPLHPEAQAVVDETLAGLATAGMDVGQQYTVTDALARRQRRVAGPPLDRHRRRRQAAAAHHRTLRRTGSRGNPRHRGNRDEKARPAARRCDQPHLPLPVGLDQQRRIHRRDQGRAVPPASPGARTGPASTLALGRRPGRDPRHRPGGRVHRGGTQGHNRHADHAPTRQLGR